jgi:hypothetical protein
MPEWLDRALFGILVVLAVSFFWGCIAGVMGAFSILIWIGGIAVIVGIVSWGEEALNMISRVMARSASIERTPFRGRTREPRGVR